MGYESKIVIVERCEMPAPNGNILVWGNELARFDLAKMGYETVNGKTFPKAFTNPIDFDLYVDENSNETGSEYFRTDKYGDHCNWATVDEVIAWLEGASDDIKRYRRAALFLDFLRVLREHEKDYEQVCVVHYGF